MSSRGRGRPSKLTAETIGLVAAAIAAGASHKTAAAVVGIGVSTLREWLARGRRARKGDEAFVALAQAVEKAAASAELADLAIIKKAAEGGDWRAAAWRLKHLYPERYGENAVTIARPSASEPEEQATVDEPPPSSSAPTSTAPVRLYEVKRRA